MLQQLSTCWRCVPALASVSVVLAAFLLIASWAALLLWKGSDEARILPNLPEAAW